MGACGREWPWRRWPRRASCPPTRRRRRSRRSRGRASTSTAPPASSTCRAPRRSRTGRSRSATASSATPPGATSPSRSCRGSRAPCATRPSRTGGSATRTGVFDPSYDLYDRSFDVQFQLLNEKGWVPSVALGLRDFLGTGVYSSEYLVASKTVAEDFTLTAGIGWGRLSGVGGFENPFCAVADSFCTREIDYGEGGTIDFGSFFHGEDAALFGGVEWRATPKFTLKAEYSPDAYTREQENSDFERKSPMNFGAEYRWREGDHAGRLLHVRRHRRLQRRVERQPEQAAHAAEPRRRAAAGQPAAGGRAAGHRLGHQPGGARQAGDGAVGGAAAEGIRLEEMQRHRDHRRGRGHRPALQPRPRGDRPHRAHPADRHAGIGPDLPHHPDAGRAAHHDGHDRAQGLRGPGGALERRREELGDRRARRRDAVAGRRLLAARRLSGLQLELRAGALPLPADPRRPDPPRPQLRPRRDGATSRRACRRRSASASR